jgi:hypothetical protein
MPISVSMRLYIEATQSAGLDGGVVAAPYKIDTGLLRLLNGIGYDQADLVFFDSRTLGGSSETLDLVGGFADAFGTTVSPAKIKAVIIANRSQTLTLTAKAASSNGWTGLFGGSTDAANIGKASSQAYGYFVWFAPQGVAITAGTGDSITIGGTAGQTYDIMVIGTSA